MPKEIFPELLNQILRPIAGKVTLTLQETSNAMKRFFSLLVATAPLLLTPTAMAASRTVFDAEHAPWYGYPYGGTTSGGAELTSQGKVIAFHGDDREYSGWTIGFDTLHLQKLRHQGGISFRIRGAQGGEKVTVGLIDDESDGKDRKTQIRADLTGYLTLTREWQTVKIPFADLPDHGSWWNEKLHTEIDAPFDWDHVIEFRLSSNQGANAKCAGSDHRFTVEVQDLQVLDSVETFDREAYWAAFRSDAPEREAVPLTDPQLRDRWLLQRGEGGSLSTSWPSEVGHGTVLRLDYHFQYWVAAVLPLGGLQPELRNWSRHRGLLIDLWSPRALSTLRVGIVDSSHESWTATVRTIKGWNRLFVPFRDFDRDTWWQPDDAVSNRRLDLGDVRTFSLQPLDAGLPGSLEVGRIALSNQSDSAPSGTALRPALLYNHLGYLPKGEKRFLVSGMTDQKDWALLDSSGKAVLQGKLSPMGRWDASGDTLAQGNFSGWNRPGRYRLSVGDFVSSEFSIVDTVYHTLSHQALRAFWFQRCGVALSPERAGIWARKAGHPDTALQVLEVPGFQGRWSAPGGWYDAGDYGKYVVNAGITLSNLLSIQETWPQAFPDGSLSIPESGNGISDLLDEARWELNWIIRMQDKDGGVFFKLGPGHWDGPVLPEQSTQPRFVIGKSVSSTLNAAAVLAQASRIWAKLDPAFSRDCRARAERAWIWANRHPDAASPKNVDGTGPYQDGTLSDEHFWAATELWITTRKPEYRTALAALAPKIPVATNAWWQEVGNLGWFTLSRRGGTDFLAQEARRGILATADSLLSHLEGSSGRMVSESFVWGSNDVQMASAITLTEAFRIDPKPAYRDAALEALDYVLGRNVLGESFVTGTGPRSPLHPHHRLLRANQLPPFPGLLVGGPNGGHEDDVSRDVGGVRWRGEPPARSWRDDERSYATNEICINWNGSLAWMLTWADRLGTAP